MRAAIDENDTGRAARILVATEELVVARGFKGITVAEIAERAHVGKGTVYLYWRTKEELVLELLARSFLSVLQRLIEELEEQPALARPSRLCPLMVRTVLDLPLVRAAQTTDTDVLGVLTADPRAAALARRHGAASLVEALVPVWRAHALARTDWEPAHQALAVQMLAVGLLETVLRASATGGPAVEDGFAVLAAAVEAVLGGDSTDSAEDPDSTDSTGRDAAAAATLAVLTDARAELRRSISAKG